jgi:hypothetical protein
LPVRGAARHGDVRDNSKWMTGENGDLNDVVNLPELAALPGGYGTIYE